jgi:hypothetical protein
MAWSVLTDPDANLGDDARAALAGLNPDTRTGLSQGLGTIINKALEKMIHPWFSKGMHDWADVDVYAAEMRDRVLVLHFIAEHYNYNFAQSGSDWADHYVFVGEAHLVGGKRKHETFALERHIHLTEHEHDDYDRARSSRPCAPRCARSCAARRRARPRSKGGRRRARIVGCPLRGSAPKAAAQRPRRRSRSRADVPLSEVPLRSGRLDAALRCLSVEVRELRPLAGFETYPEQESDGDWLGSRAGAGKRNRPT